MILNKKKYKKIEVESLINENIASYEEKLNALKERLNDLTAENASLKGELLLYKEKDAQISLALKSAEEKALNIEKRAEKRYNAEILSLKNFSVKWKTYFDYLIKKYPMYPAVTKANKLFLDIEKCVNSNLDSKSIVKIIEDAIKENKVEIPSGIFNPKKKIEEYVSSETNGFNLEEVLNPGELDLGDLCKELGLTEE